ncbi:WAS/WASL-interacting protein family member 3-like [Penaeus japonicus]|uniref:WAS/WASL-interacting protein family member 3-like n=1 Tax=Penaeus japonicus TaxID=27405 RepID=UPI001C714748|nr:WAS/WASL-interacting protein family member 3-like [Penaeus japonicus]
MSEQVATGDGGGGTWGVNLAAMHGACTPAHHAHHPLYAADAAHVSTGSVTCNTATAPGPTMTYSVPPPPLCPHAPPPDACPACALCAARDHPPPAHYHRGTPIPPASAEEARTLALQLRAAAILNKSELAVPVAAFHLSVPPPSTTAPTPALALPPPAFPYPPPTPNSTPYEDTVGVYAVCEGNFFDGHGGGPGSPSCPFHPPPTPMPALATASSTSPLTAPASPCPSISSTSASTLALGSATASTSISTPDGALDPPPSSSSDKMSFHVVAIVLFSVLSHFVI